MGGLLFNRKHFHAHVAAGVLAIWWADEPRAVPASNGAFATASASTMGDTRRLGATT